MLHEGGAFIVIPITYGLLLNLCNYQLGLLFHRVARSLCTCLVLVSIYQVCANGFKGY